MTHFSMLAMAGPMGTGHAHWTIGRPTPGIPASGLLEKPAGATLPHTGWIIGNPSPGTPRRGSLHCRRWQCRRALQGARTTAPLQSPAEGSCSCSRVGQELPLSAAGTALVALRASSPPLQPSSFSAMGLKLPLPSHGTLGGHPSPSISLHLNPADPPPSPLQSFVLSACAVT